jgi:hypothetical protein
VQRHCIKQTWTLLPCMGNILLRLRRLLVAEYPTTMNWTVMPISAKSTCRVWSPSERTCSCLKILPDQL